MRQLTQAAWLSWHGTQTSTPQSHPLSLRQLCVPHAHRPVIDLLSPPAGPVARSPRRRKSCSSAIRLRYRVRSRACRHLGNTARCCRRLSNWTARNKLDLAVQLSNTLNIKVSSLRRATSSATACSSRSRFRSCHAENVSDSMRSARSRSKKSRRCRRSRARRALCDHVENARRADSES